MLDISQYNFSDWLKFTFAHPLTTLEWYFSEDWEYQGNHSKMIEYSTKLFNAPELLVEDYFFEQINQGLWFIPSAYGYILYLLDEDIPWKIRKECIDSFYNLFLYLFSKYKISGGADIMWWDSIFSYGFYEDPVRGIKTFGESPEILKCFYDVIVQIKKIDGENIRESVKLGLDNIYTYKDIYPHIF